MADKPLLILPSPTNPKKRDSLQQDKRSFSSPDGSTQGKRLDSKFDDLLSAITAVQSDMQGVDPEQVVVFETVGKAVEGLKRAARDIPGLEFLAGIDSDSIKQDEDFYIDGEDQSELPVRFFVVFSNQSGLKEIIKHWESWKTDSKVRLPTGMAPLKNLFAQLRDVRRWNHHDRLLDTGVLASWERDLDDRKLEKIRFEIELWDRKSSQARNSRFDRVKVLVAQMGGTVVHTCQFEAIGYVALLAEMQGDQIREMIESVTSSEPSALLRCEDVMYFRAVSQSIHDSNNESEVQATGQPIARSEFQENELPPVAAILDGLPLSNHNLLRGRIAIDDPDEIASLYEVTDRRHGTEMTSLVIHGDLSIDSFSHSRRVYLRPIFVPEELWDGGTRERTPPDVLLVDLIHRCFVRMKEGEEATGTDIRIVNLSLGNPDQPFIRRNSPLARLLDYLAVKYDMLILVSAGNQLQNLDITFSGESWDDLDSDELRRLSVQAIAGDRSNRRLFSPSESINAVTVGGAHMDESLIATMGYRVDVLDNALLPAPYSTCTTGFNRSVKPDLLMPGGRLLYQRPFQTGSDVSLSPSSGISPPGLKVCSPGLIPTDFERTVYSRGSSCATALATRRAIQIYEQLLEIEAENDFRLPDGCRSTLVKALLVHGADWDLARESILDSVGDLASGPNETNSILSQLMGFGIVSTQRGVDCSNQRITFLGFGKLKADHADDYQVPMPPALNASKCFRKLSVTLAWNSPINVQHQNYRQAKLWYELDESRIGVSTNDCYKNSSRRGTVQHRVYTGEKVMALDNLPALPVRINCSNAAGKLQSEVGYGLAVTLEVAESIGVDVYTQVRPRTRVKT